MTFSGFLNPSKSPISINNTGYFDPSSMMRTYQEERLTFIIQEENVVLPTAKKKKKNGFVCLCVCVYTCQGKRKEKHKTELSAAKNAHGEMCYLLNIGSGVETETFLIKYRPADLT